MCSFTRGPDFGVEFDDCTDVGVGVFCDELGEGNVCCAEQFCVLLEDAVEFYLQVAFLEEADEELVHLDLETRLEVVRVVESIHDARVLSVVIVEVDCHER